MKVIGRTEEGVLISATEHEVRNLLGHHYWDREISVAPGLEIKVSAMFTHVETLRAQEGKLSKVASELRVMADALQMRGEFVIDPVAKERPESK